ncbi:MAG: hypothetical protein KAJ19_08535, partial [Gammaproteobacteria bacterium]|nr:hypothetical protein [Gammaproteobacteria bacterium]
MNIEAELPAIKTESKTKGEVIDASHRQFENLLKEPTGYDKLSEIDTSATSCNCAEPYNDLPIPIIEVDPAGVIINANVLARALIGNGDLVGTQLDHVVEGLGRSIRDRLADTIRGFGVGRAEMARCNHDGHDVFVQVT